MQGPVLVAYDGSPASSRAVHMFALLGLAAGRVIHAVTLNRSSAGRAEETAAQACALLRRHRAAEAHASVWVMARPAPRRKPSWG